jgi:hypothetical protein
VLYTFQLPYLIVWLSGCIRMARCETSPTALARAREAVALLYSKFGVSVAELVGQQVLTPFCDPFGQE